MKCDRFDRQVLWLESSVAIRTVIRIMNDISCTFFTKTFEASTPALQYLLINFKAERALVVFQLFLIFNIMTGLHLIFIIAQSNDYFKSKLIIMIICNDPKKGRKCNLYKIFGITIVNHICSPK